MTNTTDLIKEDNLISSEKKREIKDIVSASTDTETYPKSKGELIVTQKKATIHGKKITAKDLITLMANGEARISEHDLRIGLKYPSIAHFRRDISKIKQELEELGEIITLKGMFISDQIRSEIKYKKDPRGRKETSAFYNIRQTRRAVIRLKKTKSSEQFLINMENRLGRFEKQSLDRKARRLNEEWQMARQQCAETIDKFVKYCLERGSIGAPHYFSIITNAIYKKMLDIETGYPMKNLRDNVDKDTLRVIEMAERIVIKVLNDGMDLKSPYKEIFESLKTKLDDLSRLFGKTQVLLESTPLLGIPSDT